MGSNSGSELPACQYSEEMMNMSEPKTKGGWPAIAILGVLLCLAGGCSRGMTVKKFPPARSPAGLTVHVRTVEHEFLGELIEVRDAGIVVLAEKKVRLLRYNVIALATARESGGRALLGNRRPPDSANREDLRLLSRFPQGLSPEVLANLLIANNQGELADEKP